MRRVPAVGGDLEVHGHARAAPRRGCRGRTRPRCSRGRTSSRCPRSGMRHGADVGVEVERAAQRHVGALERRRPWAVVVGPLSSTSQALISAEHVVGHGLVAAPARFSMVRPSMRRSATRAARDLVCEQALAARAPPRSMMIGPMPSPSTRPIGHGRFVRIVHPLGGHARDAGLLLSQQRAKRRTGAVDIVHSCMLLCVVEQSAGEQDGLLPLGEAAHDGDRPCPPPCP